MRVLTSCSESGIFFIFILWTPAWADPSSTAAVSRAPFMVGARKRDCWENDSDILSMSFLIQAMHRRKGGAMRLAQEANEMNECKLYPSSC